MGIRSELEEREEKQFTKSEIQPDGSVILTFSNGSEIKLSSEKIEKRCGMDSIMHGHFEDGGWR